MAAKGARLHCKHKRDGIYAAINIKMAKGRGNTCRALLRTLFYIAKAILVFCNCNTLKAFRSISRPCEATPQPCAKVFLQA